MRPCINNLCLNAHMDTWSRTHTRAHIRPHTCLFLSHAGLYTCSNFERYLLYIYFIHAVPSLSAYMFCSHHAMALCVYEEWKLITWAVSRGFRWAKSCVLWQRRGSICHWTPFAETSIVWRTNKLWYSQKVQIETLWTSCCTICPTGIDLETQKHTHLESYQVIWMTMCWELARPSSQERWSRPRLSELKLQYTHIHKSIVNLDRFFSIPWW